MAGLYQSRRFRFEIQVRVQGRWRIEAMIDDQRDGKWFGKTDFDALERNAIGQANALLAGGRVEAVRVIRERARGDGFTTQTQVFEKAAPAEREKPLSVGRVEGTVEPCHSPVELYARPSCRVMGIVLRGFLDKFTITPLELLHHPPYMRKLSDNHAPVLQAAMHQVASLQTAGDAPLKARLARLQELIDAAERRAREALAERKLPVLEGNDLARLDARLQARFGGADARFWLCTVLTRALQGSSSYFGKLFVLLPCLQPTLSNELRGLVDEWAACCADSSQFIMDVLGPRGNLAAALVALADLADGKLAGASPDAAPLSAAFARGDLPLAADSLWERIERELGRGKPLCRDGDRAEWDLTLKLSDKLVPRAPDGRRSGCEAAINRRLDRLREAQVA